MKLNLTKIAHELTDEQVIELVTELGADRYENKEDCIVFPTICHNIDSAEANMKLYYYKRNHAFHCYTECGETFNIYELFEKRYKLLNKTYNFYTDIILKVTGGRSQEDLSESFGAVYKSLGDRYDAHTITVDIPEIPKHLLNAFVFYPTEEWLNDGISAQAMLRFKIRYSPTQNKIIIPHFDENDRLIGIRGRALNEEDMVYGKYMPVQIEGCMYKHPLGFNLYGLNMNKENIAKYKMAIVFEAEKSVLQYETIFGRDKNIAVAVCGSQLSRYQVELLKEAGAERIIVAFDNIAHPDDMEEKTQQYNKMVKLCERYNYFIQMGFIMDFTNLLGAKNSPTD